VGIEEFILQIIKGLFIELELPFEGAIGHTASALEHRNRLFQHLLEGHGRPSTAAALPLTDRRFLKARGYMAKAARVYQDHERMEWQIAPSDSDLATGPLEKTVDTFQEESHGMPPTIT
jgi:hypothetical protein